MPSLACFRWLFWRTPCTLKLLNQVLPGLHPQLQDFVYDIDMCARTELVLVFTVPIFSHELLHVNINELFSVYE